MTLLNDQFYIIHAITFIGLLLAITDSFITQISTNIKNKEETSKTIKKYLIYLGVVLFWLIVVIMFEIRSYNKMQEFLR
ncbi:hypothetical protein CLPU_15c00670 [Gottschalkia purinilytica]|uniref:Uncharacterized protein n=1 Tax=Gottschalkia purinilytica TaxID=1503 RepID=A0A0L0W7N3_GOTPU|nr:hypothetical protein [Gottschalkia purinilytica]KNF07573.1 hypothetical protein CLPU_15c00670 [Gottschalkia purinilytica]